MKALGMPRLHLHGHTGLSELNVPAILTQHTGVTLLEELWCVDLDSYQRRLSQTSTLDVHQMYCNRDTASLNNSNRVSGESISSNSPN